jgi:4-amino-4-deoxy-L-arabinose transferase-like glycosyltransferase
VAPLLHFGYGLLALVIIASLAHRAFGKDVAWLAVILLLSVPTFLTLMTRAYVDATLLFYGTAAVYALVCWRERRAQGSAVSGRGWLMAMGLFCGFCGGIKYTAVLIPIALGLSLIWVSRQDRPLTIAGRLALVVAITVAAALPGLLENWMTTGNPVYPFFFADGVYWDVWRRWWFDRPGTGLATTAPWRLLTAPLEATVLGTEGTVLYDATVGPLLLTSMATLAAVWRSLSHEERAIAGHLLLFFGLNYALWLSGLGRTVMLLQTRLLFPVFGAAAVLGGLALDRLRNLRRPQFDVAWVVRAVMSLTLALLLFSTFTMFLKINPLPVVLGLESPDDYLARRLGWYYVVVQNINRELPPDAVVLFLWEPRSYHCQVECWPDAMLDRFLHTVHLRGQDAADVASYWRMHGVTHVLLNRGGLDLLLKAQFDPITLADLRVLEDLQSRHMVLLEDFDSAYELYRLR